MKNFFFVNLRFMTCSSIAPQSVSVYVIHTHLNGSMFLLLHRSSPYLKGTWQMVSGAIKEGESAPAAALREVFEETKLVPHRLYSADAVEIFYKKSADKILFVPVFIAFIDALEAKVQLSPEEHDDYEWGALDIAQERLAFAEQKRIVLHIYQNFIANDPREHLQIRMV